MTTNEKVFDLLQRTGTNWSANKINLQSIEGHQTGSYGIFRSDNGGWLGTVRDRYEVQQNAALVQMLVEATDSLELEIVKGGVLKGGSKVFYQIGLPDMFIGKSNVRRYLSALNSHDGSTSIGLGSTNTVVICENTFSRAMTDLNKVRHTQSSTNRLKQIIESITQAIFSDNKMMETFKRMADMPMRDEIVERLVNKLFKVDAKEDDAAAASSRKKNQILTFANNLNTEIALEGKTIWGLFNAVTRYTNHHAAPQQADKKMEYLMLGRGAELSNLAYNELLSYVEANTPELVYIP
jgi:phage/plasmid-like protein (TIGR03299 family)